jgi:hypothetical protein
VITFRVLADAWNAFFFVPESAYTIAAFRVLFGVLLLINALLFRQEALLWIGPGGVLSHAQYCKVYGHSRFTLLRYLPPTNASVEAILSVNILAAACLTAGILTRPSAAVAFLTLTSLHHRNPLVVYGGDDVMRIMSFLLVFSRAGEVLSVDHWWALRSGGVMASGSAWCTRLMELQVSIIYLQAFLSKFAGSSWLTGSAVYYAVEVPKYRRSHLPAFARNLGWSRLATWGTMAIEGALGPLVWIRELRAPALAAGVALHLGMELFMNLHLFGATMIVCLTLFIEPDAMEHVLRSMHFL